MFFSETLKTAQERIIELEQQLSSWEAFTSGKQLEPTTFVNLSVVQMNQLVLNIRYLLHNTFLQNTYLRKQILSVLLSKIDLTSLSVALGFNIKTLRRSLRLKPFARIGKKTPPIKKTRVSPDAIADATKILDTLAPVKSGKNFRVVSCTLMFLYQQYVALAKQISSKPPLSYKYFIGKILDIHHNCVHFENNPDFCPHCREKDVLEITPTDQLTTVQQSRLLILNEHERIAKIQWEVYHTKMVELLAHPENRLVVQDFNQQHGDTSLQTQVLTLVVYGAPKGSLERHYYNYFLPVTQTNDLRAVIACHRDFFCNPANKFIASGVKFDIFNDGGPKHFKLTGYLAHMAQVFVYLQKRNAASSLVQHFFASYHGSGPADAVAWHLKRRLKHIRANYRHNPSSVTEMAQLCSSIKGVDISEEVVFPPELLQEGSKVSIDTYSGIKSFHKATFDNNFNVSLWVDSSSTAPSVTKQLIATSGIII